MASPREIFLRGVGHVPLAVPVLLHSHPFSALIHTISLYVSHFPFTELHIDTYTQLYVHCFKYWFLVSRCRKILRNFAKCVLSYAKCTIFFIWNEINNEIWVFLERNTKRNLVHFKWNTGRGQLGVNTCPLACLFHAFFFWAPPRGDWI